LTVSGHLGIPHELFELLDPALREALLEGRLDPDDLHELDGWTTAEPEGELRP
jgi:hypothetical protein